MYYEHLHHFRPILNLVGAAGTHNYCIACNKSFTKEHRCSKKCYKCLSIPVCEVQGSVKVICPDCNRSFFGKNCFDRHKQKGLFSKRLSVCESIYISKKCNKSVRNSSHTCGVMCCKACRQLVPYDHLSFIQNVKKNNRKLVKTKVIYLYFTI